ncbi:MAG: EI24 domain-containing protein [Planctomycetia bacterium]|nr:EI24 domain-containing protein [Planctomycetia bacterium]
MATKFWQGAAAPWQGWRLIAQHRRLWPHVVLPVLINLAVTALMFAVLLGLAAWFETKIHPWFHTNWSRWFAWLGVLLEIVAVLVLLLFAAAGAMIAWLVVAGTLGSFFYYRLARQTEYVLGTKREDLHEISMTAEVVDSLQDVAVLVMFTLLWLGVGFIPLVGPPVALVGSSYFNWFLFGSQFIGYPLSLRAARRRARINFCRKHRPHTLGLGACVFACQLVPIAGAVLLAGAVTGGVLLHRQFIEEANETQP